MDEQEQPVEEQPTFGRWMGSLWLYTLLRFALFAALWGILYLIGLSALPAGVVAFVLSIPLSLVVLARPRARVARQLELRVNAHRRGQDALSAELDPEDAARRAEEARIAAEFRDEQG